MKKSERGGGTWHLTLHTLTVSHPPREPLRLVPLPLPPHGHPLLPMVLPSPLLLPIPSSSSPYLSSTLLPDTTSAPPFPTCTSSSPFPCLGLSSLRNPPFPLPSLVFPLPSLYLSISLLFLISLFPSTLPIPVFFFLNFILFPLPHLFPVAYSLYLPLSFLSFILPIFFTSSLPPGPYLFLPSLSSTLPTFLLPPS